MGDDRNARDDGTRLTSADAGDETRFTDVHAARTPTGSGRIESTIAPGSLLGHTYRIEAMLARGGMGEVYRARHSELNTEHAIKIILPELANNQKIVDLFRREASILRTVRNDAVVAYDGVFRDENGRLYLVMEFVDGPSLSKVYKQHPLSSEDVRRLLDRLADGLATAHEKGVIHRDISPDNIILPGGDLSHAKIIDFGISKVADPEAKTIVGDDFAGKYSYVSPEQLGMFGGRVDARSDIYSLGLVLAAAAIGEPLDMGMTPISVIEARRDVPDLSRVPADLRPDLAAMLQPDPAKRPQTMRELIREPARSPERREGHRSVVEPKRDKAAARRPQTARPRIGIAQVVGGLAVLIVVAGGAGYWFMMQPAAHKSATTTAAVESGTPGTAASTAPSASTAGSQPAQPDAGTATAATPSPTAGQTAQDFIAALKPTGSPTQSATAVDEANGTPPSVAAAPRPETPPAASTATPATDSTQATTATAAATEAAGTPGSTPSAEIPTASATAPIGMDASTSAPSGPQAPAAESTIAASTDTAGAAPATAAAQPLTTSGLGNSEPSSAAAAPAATDAVPSTPAASPPSIATETGNTTGTQTAMAVPDVAGLAADARRAVQGLPCAQVRIDVSQAGDVATSGYVGTAADGERAAAAIAAIPGVGQVTNGVAIMKWPLCETLGVLSEQAVLGPDQPAAPRIDPGGVAGVYREGDHLQVGVTATSAYDGYLYVDYVDAAEQYVVHLLPNDLRPDNRVRAGQRVVIGTLAEEAKNYTVSPPFGTNLIVAVSSPQPLFSSRRPLLEQANDYLPALRNGLKSVAAQAGPEKLFAGSSSVIFKAR